MIAEPYIHLKTGVIGWAECDEKQADWQFYADFEREKLAALCNGQALRLDGCWGYRLNVPKIGKVIYPGQDHETRYDSRELIGYAYLEWLEDTESSRLLKRAEFLKAV